MERKGAEDCEFLIYLLVCSTKLSYLQLITVLIYGNGSPKSHEQGYLNFQQKLWKIRLNEFLSRTCNFTKSELFLRYFSRIFFQSFKGLLSSMKLLFFRTLPGIFLVTVNALYMDMILCTSLLLYSFYYYIFRSNQTIQVIFSYFVSLLPWKYSYLERMLLRHHSYFLQRHPFLGLSCSSFTLW